MAESNIVRRSLYTFLTEAGLFLSGIAISVLTARLLQPEGKGLLTLLILIPSTVVALGKLGLDVANTYYASREPASRSGLAANSVVVALGWGGLLAVGGLAALWLIPGLEGRRGLLTLALLLVPLALLLAYMASLFLGMGQVKFYNLLRLGNALVYLAGVVLGTLVGLTVGKAFLGWALGVILMSAVGLGLIRRQIPLKLSWQGGLFRPTLKFGMQVQVGFVAAYLNRRLDHFLVVGFLDAGHLGLYTIAVTMTEALALLPIAISAVLLPTVANMGGRAADELVAHVLRLATLFVLVSALILFVGAPLIIKTVFGAAYLPALPALRLLLIGAVGIGVSDIVARALVGRGYPLIPSLASFLGLAFTLALDLLLIPRLGLAGAAIASSLSYSLGAVFVTAYYLHLSRLSWQEMFVVRGEDLAGLWRTARGGRFL